MKTIIFFLMLFTSIVSHADIYFSDVSCGTIRTVSLETMQNWQNGYSFKDMLESTDKYGDLIHSKDGTSLQDSRQYAYNIAQDAMDKPVRKFEVYKNYMAYVFSNEREADCLLRQDGSYSSIAFAEQLKECDELADYASEFMESRQSGLPIEPFLSVNQQEYDKRIHKESYRADEIEETYLTTKLILEDVYQHNIHNTEFEKEKAVIEYGRSYYDECLSI